MAFDDQSAEPDIQLVVSLGHTGDQALYLRVTPDAAPELKQDLEDAHVYAGEILEFTAGQELVIYAGSIAAGLGSLAAALSAFFHRNQHKSISFSHDGEPVEIKGYSEQASQRLINRVLEEAAQKQFEQDTECRRILRSPEDDSTAS